MKRLIKIVSLLFVVTLLINFHGEVEVQAVRGVNLQPKSVTNMTTDLSKIKITIGNEGYYPAEDFKITFWINGDRFRKQVDWLGGNSKQTVVVDTNITQAGVYNYSVLVDSLAQVNESNEQDNKLKEAVKIEKQSATTELTIDYPDEIKAEQKIEIIGTTPPAAKEVIISVDGWPLTNQQGDKLLPVNNGQYRLQYSFSQSGEDRKLVVKAFDEQGEVIARISRQLRVYPKAEGKVKKRIFSANENKEINLGVIEQGATALVAISPLELSTHQRSYNGNLEINYADGGRAYLNKQNQIVRSSKQRRDYNQTQLAVDRKMRQLEEKLLSNLSRQEMGFSINSLANKQAAVKQTKSFYVQNKGRITAQLKENTKQSLVYVERGVEVAEAALEKLAAEFDDQIFPTDMKYFAQHKYDKYYDQDNNGQVIILITDLGRGSGQGTLLGFFNPRDMLPNSSPRSNAADMFYLNSQVLKQGKSGVKEAFKVLAHEFQHLIFFTEKLVAGRKTTDVWINEGFAVLAEKLNGYYSYAQDYKVTNGYFKKTAQESLLSWDNKLRDYGASGLFAGYLYHQLGSEAIAEIITAQKEPVKVISRYRPFNDLYLDWLLTNYISDRSVNSRYSYPFQLGAKPSITEIKESRQLNFPIVDTGVKYFKIKGSGSEVKLDLELNQQAGIVIYK